MDFEVYRRAIDKLKDLIVGEDTSDADKQKFFYDFGENPEKAIKSIAGDANADEVAETKVLDPVIVIFPAMSSIGLYVFAVTAITSTAFPITRSPSTVTVCPKSVPRV